MIDKKLPDIIKQILYDVKEEKSLLNKLRRELGTPGIMEKRKKSLEKIEKELQRGVDLGAEIEAGKLENLEEKQTAIRNGLIISKAVLEHKPGVRL